MSASSLINHVWQSSAFALMAGAVAFLLRRNSAQVRFWVWLCASVKFLLPFALLVSLGSLAPRRSLPPVSVAGPVFSENVVRIAEPFSTAPDIRVPLHERVQRTPIVIGVVWAFGFFAIVFSRLRGWRRVRASLLAGVPVDLPIPVRAVATTGAAEPGVVGFLRPVLVLPSGLVERLEPQQLRAVLAHEMCHVRRRDNFFAALHMVVEAIFWFHPLAWWIGSRMVEERELACDEEVLRMGCEPSDYVEGILKVCRSYAESPLACVSGVTGADVKKRLRSILDGCIARELSSGKRVALATMGVVILSAPVAIGVIGAPFIQAQSAPANTPKFEVASIRPCSEPENGPNGNSKPGRLVSDCNGLLNFIGNAYNGYASGYLNINAEPTPITGSPSWVASAFYRINATAEGSPSVTMMLGPMMQALLEDRFQLKIHRETVEGPVYFLTVAHGGPKLHPSVEGSCVPWSLPPVPLEGRQEYCLSLISGLGKWPSLNAHGSTLDEFSKTLHVLTGRTVIDRTGVSGRFDMRVEFSPDGSPLSADPNAPPSIFVAIQEQLGLKLEAGRGPVQTLVVDHIERPSEN